MSVFDLSVYIFIEMQRLLRNRLTKSFNNRKLKATFQLFGLFRVPTHLSPLDQAVSERDFLIFFTNIVGLLIPAFINIQKRLEFFLTNNMENYTSNWY